MQEDKIMAPKEKILGEKSPEKSRLWNRKKLCWRRGKLWGWEESPVQEDKAWEQRRVPEGSRRSTRRSRMWSRSGEKHLQAAENRLENRKSLPRTWEDTSEQEDTYWRGREDVVLEEDTYWQELSCERKVWFPR